MNIVMIAAMTPHNGIGFEGRLIHDDPDDMMHFKNATKHKPVIMGRKTYEEIGKPLSDRHNIVLTTNPLQQYPDSVEVASSVSQAMNLAYAHLANPNDDIMVIGGGHVYEQFMPYAQVLILTQIQDEFSPETSPVADVWFPSIDMNQWKLVSSIQDRNMLRARYLTIKKFVRRIPHLKLIGEIDMPGRSAGRLSMSVSPRPKTEMGSFSQHKEIAQERAYKTVEAKITELEERISKPYYPDYTHYLKEDK